MMNSRRLPLAAAVLAFGGAIAHADPYDAYDPSWYVTPSVIGINPDNTFGVDDEGIGAGLRFGKSLSPHWDLQFGPTLTRSEEHGMRYDQGTLGADFLLLLSRDRFRPFLLVGGGAQYDEIGGPGRDSSSTSPYLNGGVGFQYSFSERWSTQVDVRRVHGFLNGNGFGSGHSDNDYLSVGLSYRFSAPERTVTEVREERRETVAAAAPAPAPAAPVEHYTLSSTELFGFDSDHLAASQPKLDEIATALKANLEVDDVVVTGYTDRIGPDEYNNRLSMRRAEAVKAYLVDHGVDPAHLRAVGKGEADPVVQCQERDRAALIRCLEPNRRVEIEKITFERHAE